MRLLLVEDDPLHGGSAAFVDGLDGRGLGVEVVLPR